MRGVLLATLVLAGSGGVAAAQPADPYAGGGGAPVGGGDPNMDPALAENVAASIVARAQELFDARLYADSKQLAIEAMAVSGGGASAEKARAIVKQANAALGISDAPPTPPIDPNPPVDPNEHLPPPPPPHEGIPERPHVGGGKMAARVHLGMYAAALGATVGTAFSDTSDGQVAPAVTLGVVAGAGAAVFLSPVLDRHFSEAQIRTMGSGATWGGVIGGLMADVTTGVGMDADGTTGRQAMIGISIGSTLGAAAGYGLARRDTLTVGDVALIDTLAGIGTIGGLTMGMLMQPVQSEAYSLNAAIGASGGVLLGLIYAPQTNTTPRRMARVAGYSALGAAIPFLLYAGIYDSNSDGDERIVGLLSTAGLVGGMYWGFRSTKHMDEGKDVKPGVMTKPGTSHDDAPPAAIGRASDGSWSVGMVGVQPLSKQLDSHQHGMGFTLLGGRF